MALEDPSELWGSAMYKNVVEAIAADDVEFLKSVVTAHSAEQAQVQMLSATVKAGKDEATGEDFVFLYMSGIDEGTNSLKPDNDRLKAFVAGESSQGSPRPWGTYQGLTINIGYKLIDIAMVNGKAGCTYALRQMMNLDRKPDSDADSETGRLPGGYVRD